MNDEGQRIAVAVQAGDRIRFGKYAQRITPAGETYLILREDEVLLSLAVVGPEDHNAGENNTKK